MPEYIWTVTNPFGAETVLKQTTYDADINDIEKRTDKEIEHLQLVSDAIKGIIRKPRFIYWDKDGVRHNYIDLISLEGLNHIQGLVVVVDADRDPNEVVTWTIKRHLRQEKGGIIYDYRAESQV